MAAFSSPPRNKTKGETHSIQGSSPLSRRRKKRRRCWGKTKWVYTAKKEEVAKLRVILFGWKGAAASTHHFFGGEGKANLWAEGKKVAARGKKSLIPSFGQSIFLFIYFFVGEWEHHLPTVSWCKKVYFSSSSLPSPLSIEEGCKENRLKYTAIYPKHCC